MNRLHFDGFERGSIYTSDVPLDLSDQYQAQIVLTGKMTKRCPLRIGFIAEERT
jgi:hypothetical protein